MKLKEHVNILSGYAFDSKLFNETGDGIPIIRIRDIGKERISTYFSGSYKNDFIIKRGDLLIGMDGDFRLSKWMCEDALLNQRVCKIEVKSNRLNTDYLYYILPRELKLIEDSTSFATVKHLSVKKIQEIEIPLPPLEQQKKIAAILDAADAYRQKTKALITKYDELTQSLFLDMFGDPVKNEKGWEKVSLSEYGSFKNGLNFNTTEAGVKIKYLGVGDFKSKSRIDNAESLSDIELNSLPNDSYLLNDGDLVFVRSNGNRALVGRCVEVYPKNHKLTFSGFCIRYRINSQLVKPTYLSQLFRNKSFKNLMFESGQGANIQNINQQILSGIAVPLPSLNMQEYFEQSIQSIEEQKAQSQASLEKAEELFNSLLKRAFKGELV